MTPLESLGEFGLIERLTQSFAPLHPTTLKAIGDDAAVTQPVRGRQQLLTTDMLLEGVHFDLAYVPLMHLGYKAVVVNLSDIYAMNGTPYGITVAIGMSNRFTVEALEELYAGIRLACETYNVDLLGGDTCSSRQGLVLSITAVGDVEEGRAVYRNGAKPTDLICVSGDLGGAYAGFLVLDREKKVFLENPEIQPDLNDFDYVVSRQLKPEARKDMVEFLRQHDILPTAMIDISDGLASELHHICRQSGCGAAIYSDKLPIDFQTISVAESFDISPVAFATNGGEDYEMLFTVPISAYESLKAAEGISIIGHITPDAGMVRLMYGDGSAADLKAEGWNHFRKG